MVSRIKNIYKAKWTSGKNLRGEPWSEIDLSGENMGVRLEELPPGSRSSEHHYHTAEEEHVLILKGTAALILGEEEITLTPGDHIWFKAGEEVPHHIENRSQEPLQYLVFGERKEGDVVFYPKHQVAMFKKLDRKLYRYEAFEPPTDDKP